MTIGILIGGGASLRSVCKESDAMAEIKTHKNVHEALGIRLFTPRMVGSSAVMMKGGGVDR